MPRKSIADVLTERHGGKWTFNRNTSDRWHSDDDRTVYRRVDCKCWMFGNTGKCTCKPYYVLSDGKSEQTIDVNDPCVYRLNGLRTKDL